MEYPHHWEADVVLRDGGTAHVRPINPGDAVEIQRMHSEQSPESVYFRFFAPMPTIPEKDLRHFTHVDHRDRVAFVATIGERIVGIARYDRVDAKMADVAFNIADKHQGRGLGSIFLEHLAAAAQENGIRRFVAEVHPDNHKMLSVFTEAGYEVRHRLDDGIIALGFTIDPTSTSMAVMQSREHSSEAISVSRIVSPQSVVLIGASRREGTIGHALVQQILRSGYTGEVHIVHPQLDTVPGMTCHKDLSTVPGPIDLAVIAVPAAAVLDVAKQCAAQGVHALLVISSNFAEAGPEGLQRQRDLVRLVRDNGMRIVGPNSWGVLNTDPDVKLNVTLRGDLPQPGSIGVFCQSGALSAAVLEVAAHRGIGISSFLSVGNRSDVSGNDCLQYWDSDERTHAIAMYLENMGNPRKFFRIARRVSANKPVVMLTSFGPGRSAPTPTGVTVPTLPQQAYDAMFTQSGCIRVDTVRHMLDVSRLLVDQPLPRGHRVAIIASSTVMANLLADTAQAWGLENVRDPIAVQEAAAPGELRDAIREALADPGVDIVIAAYAPALQVYLEDVLTNLSLATQPGPLQPDASPDASPEAPPATDAATADAAPVPDGPSAAGTAPAAEAPPGPDAGPTEPAIDRSDVPPVTLVACLIGMPLPAQPIPDARWGTPIPVYATPEEALRAVTAVTRYSQWRQHIHEGPVTGCHHDAAHAMVQNLLRRYPEGVELADHEVEELLGYYELSVEQPLGAVTMDNAALGGAISQVPGVNLLDAEQQSRSDAAAVECVLTSVEDPRLGPVVTFSLAGDARELLGDIAYRIAPLASSDVEDLLHAVRSSPRLFDRPGQPDLDIAALKEVITKLSCLANDLPEVASIEFHPVVVGTHGVQIRDAAIRIAPLPDRPGAPRRELTAAW